MLNIMRNKPNWCLLLPGILAASLLAGSGAASAAAVTVNLCATKGKATMPGAPAQIDIFGYVSGSCPAAATVPGGPVIDVNVGDVVTVILRNSLPEATAMLFQGQRMLPDTTGAAAGTGSTYPVKTYTFTAANPGTFVYEAAMLPNSEHQTAMGLYGALIVRPIRPVRTDTAGVVSGSAVVTDTAVLATDVGSTVTGTGIAAGTTITAVTAGTSFTMSAAATAAGTQVTVTGPAMAYGDAATSFSDEAVLVVSELDPALNSSTDPATFDMRDYAPKYFLINGKAYPDTATIASAAGNKVLLRYVNAGVRHHSMAVLGLRQNFVAKDAGPLPLRALNVAAETLAPGQTGDAIVTVPAVTSASRFAVYDGSLMLHNNGAANGYGGMLTFVTAGAGSADTGPATNSVALSPNPTNGSVSVALTGSVSSAASTITEAKYFIDTAGTAGTGLAMGGAFGAATVAVSATISSAQLAALPTGNHTMYVYGKDANNKWGSAAFAVLNLDKAGPLTSGITLTPNPSAGGVSVAIHATGDDSASGGSTITQAEYFRGATGANGSGTPMTVNVAAPVASLDATIAPPVTAGIVSVHSRDALGNWGSFATIPLNVVAAGPVTSNVGITPSGPNNGTLALGASQPVVRVKATMVSTGSTVSAAEGFIDTVGANGTGFPFVPGDGAWNSASETGYADIPLATIKALADGNHTIYVRGKDATGNWGALSTVILLIDKIAPTFTGVSLAPNPTNGATSITLTVNGAADPGGAGVAGGQYWIDGTATPPANATAFSAASATINTSALTWGSHIVYARVKDAATNWSAVSSTTLNVMQAVDDTLTMTANGNVTQTNTVSQPGVLGNDKPGGTGRTATLVSGPERTSVGTGTGTGTISVTCGAATATGVCPNGSYRVTLTGVGARSPARQASKLGTYQFKYTETFNGMTTTPATVTITVN